MEPSANLAAQNAKKVVWALSRMQTASSRVDEAVCKRFAPTLEFENHRSRGRGNKLLLRLGGENWNVISKLPLLKSTHLSPNERGRTASRLALSTSDPLSREAANVRGRDLPAWEAFARFSEHGCMKRCSDAGDQVNLHQNVAC